MQGASGLGFGKAKPGTGYQALYLIGTVKNVTGVFRSTGKGATWVRVNDKAHQRGAIGGVGVSTGDPDTYGAGCMSAPTAAACSTAPRRPDA